MGRHTADNESVRAPRQGDSTRVIGERRAALERDRTTRPSLRPATRTARDASPSRARGRSDFAAPLRDGVPQSPVIDDVLVAEHAAAARRRAASVERHRQPIALVQQDQREPAKTLANSFLRRRTAIPALSFLAVFGFVGGSLVNPLQADIASAAVIAAPAQLRTVPSQHYSAHGTYAGASINRDGYSVTNPKPVVVTPPAPTVTTTTTKTAAKATTPAVSAAAAPAAGTPSPGSAKAIAQQMVAARGWDASQYNCLVSLWNKESGWNVYAYNPSGAYGIPQSLPGSKMATAGADWQTNPATQITWGLNYITGSYGTPCGAWAHSQAYNWY
ncbi:transglycosylase SLT domain-containing protein [Curtobacterium ammoniigenes]|uniref:aggregation-promoting factor C-terminal-like domain-containing protein n=1 Tax=Curtobacterium ammoniigenes TaxID=395387 RepID=UPI000B0D1AFE|nr:transglycosylase SLT domain-containing protein [Curtobacterium ammoniigenes]